MYRGFSMRQSFWWKQKMHIPVNLWITSSVDRTSSKTHESSRAVWFFALSRLILLLLSSKLNPCHSLISIPDVNKTLWQRPMRMQPITSHFHSYLCSVSPYRHIKFDSPVIRILKRTHISAWYHPTNLLSQYTWMFSPGELLYTHGPTQLLRNYSWLYLGEYSRRVTTDPQRSQTFHLFLCGVSVSPV